MENQINKVPLPQNYLVTEEAQTENKITKVIFLCPFIIKITTTAPGHALGRERQARPELGIASTCAKGSPSRISTRHRVGHPLVQQCLLGSGCWGATPMVKERGVIPPPV